MNAPLTIVGLGELLWDLFPTARQLGGAPANFAYCSHLLGDNGTVVSRVGADEHGNDIRESLATFGLTDDFVQSDDEHPTGTVKVKLDKAGQPDFTITDPSAWDFLEWNAPLQHLAKSADAVAFGTLAQRSPVSKQTIRAFLDELRPEAAKVFDVNLRQSFYSAEVLRASISRATIVKLNQDEVSKVAALLELPVKDLRSFGREVLDKFNLPLICITRGEKGSLLLSATEAHDHPGYRVKVRDAVGAGDAFTAGLVNQVLHGAPLAEANDFAKSHGCLAGLQLRSYATRTRSRTARRPCRDRPIKPTSLNVPLDRGTPLDCKFKILKVSFRAKDYSRSDDPHSRGTCFLSKKGMVRAFYNPRR